MALLSRLHEMRVLATAEEALVLGRPARALELSRCQIWLVAAALEPRSVHVGTQPAFANGGPASLGSFLLLFLISISLTSPGLSCSMWDLVP